MPVTRCDLNLSYNANGKILKKDNFNFARNTTYGCGGVARIAYFPDGIVSAKKVYDIASHGNFVVLGNGSNVLAADSFYDGAVICTRNLSGIYRVSDDILCCLAGTKISKLLNYCIKKGFGGIEYLYGIPATIGGAAYMNAGVRGTYIADNIVKVRLYNGKQFDILHKDCKFSYKHSTMRDIKSLILAVYIKVSPNCNIDQITNNLLYYKDMRKNLPKGKSCGCVFKNFSDVSAGKIIEDCNLAKLSVGNVYVSERHCNFFINHGTAASDVKKLIDIVKQKVYEKTSRILEEEVTYIGEFNDSYC